MAITTLSGRVVSEREEPPVEVEDPVNEEVEIEAPAGTHFTREPEATAPSRVPPADGSIGKNDRERSVEATRAYYATAIYPGRSLLDKIDYQYDKFIELIRQRKANLPFIETLCDTPKYLEFLMDIMATKRKLKECSHVTLSEECSAILQNKLPVKMDDPA